MLILHSSKCIPHLHSGIISKSNYSIVNGITNGHCTVRYNVGPINTP